MSVDDTKPAPLSAARLAEIREWAQAAKHDTRKRSLQLVLDAEALFDHLDALALHAALLDARLALGVVEALGAGGGAVPPDAWAQMEPDPKAEYVSRALALVAIGYAAGAVAMTGEGDDPGTEGAILVLMKRHDEELHEAHAAGRGEGDAERAALAAELAKRDAEIEGLRCELAKRDALTAEARAALTPRAPVDGEALGRALFFALHPGGDLVWNYYEDESKAPWIAAALTLYQRGHAAGRSEGEADRAALVKRFDFIDGERRAALDDVKRLADELAEARAAWRESVDRRQATVATLDTLAAEHEAASAREREAIREAVEARAALAAERARRVEATERHEGEPLMLLVDGVRVPRHTVVVYTCADCGIGEECYCEDPRFEDAPEQDGAP